MRPSAGLADDDTPTSVRLRKSLYELSMTSAQVCEHSDATLKYMGFYPIIFDPRIYAKLYKDNTRAYISVHVGDFCIASSHNVN